MLGELVVTIAATWVFVASSGRIVDAQGIPNRSTLLVLGSLVSDGEPGSYVRGRLDTALELYRTGAVARVVVSGNGDADAGDEPAVMRDYLEAHGVPASVIVDDPAGYDTERSCRRLPEVIGGAASNPVVIVTQDFHVSRAIARVVHVGSTRSASRRSARARGGRWRATTFGRRSSLDPERCSVFSDAAPARQTPPDSADASGVPTAFTRTSRVYETPTTTPLRRRPYDGRCTRRGVGARATERNPRAAGQVQRAGESAQNLDEQ